MDDLNSTAVDSGNDLSSEIAKTISKEPRDQVTCRRVSGNHYRCNWWALAGTGSYDNPGMNGMLVTTSRIRQSQFLHVTKSSEGLQIRVVSALGK